MFIFDIEAKIAELFDATYPPSPLGNSSLDMRGYKPLLAESLGFIVPDSNTRRLTREKEYFQVDQDDFLEFATSTLPKEATLPDFTDDRLLIYSFLDGENGSISTEYLGSEVKVSLLDVIIARHGPGVSVTTRLAYKGDADGKWISAGTDRWEELVTLTYFPGDESHPGLGSTLVEWDRSVVLCPVSTDAEWRFILADGPYAEYLRKSIQDDPASSKQFGYVSRIVENSSHEAPKYAVQIELTRLCLCLPQYIGFMYDLISAERVKARELRTKSVRSTQPLSRSGVVYKIVKSIRVIRPPAASGATVIRWSSPKRRHLVAAHWRVFSIDRVSGKDDSGNRVLGKTWVRDHVRGISTTPIPEVAESNVPVTVRVKQTLESARDELRAKSARQSTARVIDLREHLDDPSKKPSREWMAGERAKLTAGLRYLVLKRDCHRCKSCGLSPVETNGIQLEVDHIRSVLQWGRTEVSNLQTLCRQCNRGKGARR